MRQRGSGDYRSPFLRAWLATYGKNVGDDAEDDEQEQTELDQLARLGACREWQKGRKKR
jgi:hypothetical protein